MSTEADTAERDRLRAELERADVLYHRSCEIEHALRAEVERLDAEKPWLKEANARAAHAEAEIERWRDSNNRLRAEMESQAQRAEREKVRVLREALENLRDEQNGAPLCTRETEWKEAMDEADAALAATKEDSR